MLHIHVVFLLAPIFLLIFCFDLGGRRGRVLRKREGEAEAEGKEKGEEKDEKKDYVLSYLIVHQQQFLLG